MERDKNLEDAPAGRPLSQAELIRVFILLTVERHPRDVVRLAAEEFGVSRQTVHRHVRALVDAGRLEAKGKTKAREYHLVRRTVGRARLDVTPGLEEDRVWRKYVVPHLGPIPENVFDICQYGFTEIFNNVVDHSRSEKVQIWIEQDPVNVGLFVDDEGVGIFEKIQNEKGLSDPRHALLELSKGKLTTDPERHSGEGIYFASRAFDHFYIYSGSLYFSRRSDSDSQWLLEVEDRAYNKGTLVGMRISRLSKRKLEDVFKAGAAADHEYEFSRTHVPIELLKYAGNEKLVSRSQAKRLLARFERFREVILDFSGISSIGQAFADEIFRVFANKHPDILVIPLNANKRVQGMIDRATSGQPVADQRSLFKE